MRAFTKRFAQDQSGVTALEYGLIAFLVAIIGLSGTYLLVPKVEKVMAASASNKPVD